MLAEMGVAPPPNETSLPPGQGSMEICFSCLMLGNTIMLGGEDGGVMVNCEESDRHPLKAVSWKSLESC